MDVKIVVSMSGVQIDFDRRSRQNEGFLAVILSARNISIKMFTAGSLTDRYEK